MSSDQDFIKIGNPVCPKYGSGNPGSEHNERIVVYITEIWGDLIITTGGSYNKEDLGSVQTVATRLIESAKWAEDVVKNNTPLEERLLRIGEAISGYYMQLDAKALTEEDFNQWIESLQEPMKGAFRNKGLEDCRGVLNFQRFILELSDMGLDKYLERELSPEDYSYYLEQGK